MNAKTRKTVNVISKGMLVFCIIRAVQILPREGALRREQECLGRVQGIDWDWKQPADWRERLFGLQQVVNHR